MEFDNKQNTDVSSILYILYMCIKYYNIDNIITNKKKHTPPTRATIATTHTQLPPSAPCKDPQTLQNKGAK